MRFFRVLCIILLNCLLCCGVITADHTLEDQFRSSSVFSSYEQMAIRADGQATIDSRQSVENYTYRLLTRTGSHDKRLKDISYDFWDEVKIPGMPDTKLKDLEENRSFSTALCPQGLCFSDEFLFLTAYSSESGRLGEIMVFSRDTAAYLFTIGMNQNSHLGGITFDGDNLWACNSDHNTLERLSYDFVRLMAQENMGELVDASSMVDVYPVKQIPSCITCHDGRLFIATHTLHENGELTAYYYDDREDCLVRMSSYQIPPMIQGIAFSWDGKVYLSQSYGRRSSSYLLIYDQLADVSAFPEEPVWRIEMPPCSEELAFMENRLYLLFESAGEKYYEGTDGYGGSLSPIDEILCIPLNNNGYIISK